MNESGYLFGALLLLAFLILMSFAAPSEIEIVEAPRLTVECPDPESRRRLRKGDTFRDLARAHASAVAGWQRCYDAAEINAGKSFSDGD